MERFKATSGLVVGSLGLAVVAFAIGYTLYAVRGAEALRIALALGFFGTLVWATQIRPRVTAYPDTLRLHNSVRDAFVPLAAIDRVNVRQTLNVWVGAKRYTCVGIGKPARALIRGRSRPKSTMPLLGFGRVDDYSHAADRPHPEQTSTSYPDYVVMRIEDLAEQAKKDAGGADPGKVRRRLAVPEVALLVATGAGFLLSLVLG